MSARSEGGRATRSGMYGAILEVLPEIVLIHDRETILFANAACRRFLGAGSPSDLEGHSIDEIVHPDAREAGRERRGVLFECGRALKRVPLKLVSLDGRPRHVVADAHPLSFDDVSAAMVVAVSQRA